MRVDLHSEILDATEEVGLSRIGRELVLTQPRHLLVRRAYGFSVTLAAFFSEEFEPDAPAINHGIVRCGTLVFILECQQLDWCTLPHGLREVRRFLIANVAQVAKPLRTSIVV